MSDQRKPGLMVAAVAVVVIMLGLYVGAYYATVDPRVWKPIPGWIPHYRVAPGLLGKAVFVVDDWAVSFFAPMNWIDRRIRPHVWNP